VGRETVASGDRAAARRQRIPSASDRRLVRGVRTREAIVEAMIDLIESGNARPTSSQLAEEAGVSVGALHYHFGYVDLIVDKAAALQVSRHCRLIALIPPHRTVEARIGAICHQRRQVLEALAPVLRVAYSRLSASPGLRLVLAEQRALLRGQVATTFGPEIASAGPDDGMGLYLLDLATGWQNWDRVRFQDGRSVAYAQRLMHLSLTVLLR
jgi:TetR/AcrR family transcriptional regulator of autoinduction and epiphytic fitness